MALAETQALLARLFTGADVRRDFFADPRATARRFGLSEAQAQTIAALDRAEVEAFASSLLGKRALDARKVLPLTSRVLGADFDRLLCEAIDGPPPKGRHRADAAALAASLAGKKDVYPPWIGDLARYETAFVAAARPGVVLRRFAWPVNDIARQLIAGARPEIRPRRRVGLWLRAPWGRRFFWMI